MPQFDFYTNKTLKMTNVLSKKIPDKEIFNQSKQIEMLQNWVKAKGCTRQGPIIFYNSLKGVKSDGESIIEAKIMIQLKETNVKIVYPYSLEDLIRVKNCLYVRFDGKVEDYASMKIQVYAYENDLELTNEIYYVLLKDTDDKMTADIFMPVRYLCVGTGVK